MAKRKPKKSDKNPVGRPTKYERKYCDQLISHMEEGLSFESFAGVIRVCKQTLYTWEAEHKEFLDARKLGTDLCRLYWEKIGRDHIINESFGKGESKSLNATIWIFNMKNRFRDEWRDKQPGEDDHTVKHTGEVTVKKTDLEDRISQMKGNK